LSEHQKKLLQTRSEQLHPAFDDFSSEVKAIFGSIKAVDHTTLAASLAVTIDFLFPAGSELAIELLSALQGALHEVPTGMKNSLCNIMTILIMFGHEVHHRGLDVGYHVVEAYCGGGAITRAALSRGWRCRRS
jgi:hypothetical protein